MEVRSPNGSRGANLKVLAALPSSLEALGESLPRLSQLPEAAYLLLACGPVQELDHSHFASVLTPFSDPDPPASLFRC